MLAISFSCLLTLVLFLPGEPQSAAAQETRSLLVEGTRLLEANQAEAARIKFETALKLDPASAEAWPRDCTSFGCGGVVHTNVPYAPMHS